LNDQAASQCARLLFVGLSGYQYPHTRVRCYHFAKALAGRPGLETDVLSFKDHLAAEKTERDMYELRDREKMRLALAGFKRLWAEKGSVFYLQKALFHAAPACILSRLGRNKYIYDCDDYDIPLSQFFAKGRWNRLLFGSHKWDEITYKIARRSLCCVAASHFLWDMLAEHNSRVYLVHTGVDTTVFTPPEKRSEDGPVFLWNGLIWGDVIVDNVTFILRCFNRVKEKYPNAVLRIVGGGVMADEVHKYHRDNFPALEVEYTSWLDPREMPQVLREVHVGLLPLIQNDDWIKSKSPTKLFEYMSSELAVVSSNIGEATHVIQNGIEGLLVDDEESFTGAMMSLCEKPEMIAQLGQAARKRVEADYCLPALADKLYDMLVEVGVVCAS
jgi:glycosyltransferase involved in cell wall biosynthesis